MTETIEQCTARLRAKGMLPEGWVVIRQGDTHPGDRLWVAAGERGNRYQCWATCREVRDGYNGTPASAFVTDLGKHAYYEVALLCICPHEVADARESWTRPSPAGPDAPHD